MNGDEGTRLLLNHNKMLKYYDGAIGVKTGFTKRSGRCLVSAAERNGVRMIAVTLSAPDDWNDHRAMLDYGFSLYTHVDFAEPGSVSVQMPVTGGTSEFITLSNKDHGHICLSVNSADIRCVIEAPRFVYAPINKDDIIGHACYYVGDKEITRLPLYADSECPAIDEPSLWKRITAFFK